MLAAATHEATSAIYVGGNTASGDLNGRAAGFHPLIARLDMTQNTWAWRKGFDVDGSLIETITALAVNPDGTKIAAHG